jgi:hypothetical protein
MSRADFPVGEMTYGHVKIFAAFCCDCGARAAMGDQDNGNAAMLHETPHCGRFEAVRTLGEAKRYYASLLPVPLTEDFCEALRRNQALG